MNAPANAIRLYRDPQRTRVEYRRADLGGLFANLPAEEALKRVPLLLTVCADAQSVAAARALEAARETEETQADCIEREQLLLQEQAQAAAWRLLVDWPRALGEAPDLKRLKSMRQGSTENLVANLRALLPTSLLNKERTDHEAFIDECLVDVMRNPGLISERVLGESLGEKRSWHEAASEPITTLRGLPLWERARGFLGGPLLTTCALGLAADADPLTIGPLAMGRHWASDHLAATDHIPLLTRLLLASLLDTAFIIDALGVGDTRTLEPRQRCIAPGVGVGAAMTARGPLFHMVAVDPRGRVQHWRHLAPTDWHFAPGGLVDRLVEDSRRQQQLRLLILAADPCAPCDINPDLITEAA